MILDATTLTTYQSCARKFILNAQWRSIKWRPKSLFDACLRRGIVAVSSGADPAAAASSAKAQFMQTAANPGLDALGNTFLMAKDWCAMLDTILRTLGGLTLLTIKDAALVKLNSTVSWQPLAQQDDSGQLHRWITVDAWGQDDLMRELHSWYVTGDIAMTRIPLTLHVIKIGRIYKDRRASAWARAWQHPAIPTLRLRFKHFETWKPVYLADRAHDMDPDAWVEQLWKEDAVKDLIQHIAVKVPSEHVCVDTQRQVLLEAARMAQLLLERPSHRALPMCRAACDGHVPCHFQPVCYTEQSQEISGLGLYQIRNSM